MHVETLQQASLLLHARKAATPNSTYSMQALNRKSNASMNASQRASVLGLLSQILSREL